MLQLTYIHTWSVPDVLSTLILLCPHHAACCLFGLSTSEVCLGRWSVSYKTVFGSGLRVFVWLQPPGRRIHGVGAVRGGAPVLGQAVRNGGPVLLIGEKHPHKHRRTGRSKSSQVDPAQLLTHDSSCAPNVI